MQTTVAQNPFLPIEEYVPDGEPHVFGDRVYLFGSHDQEGGDSYCVLDYVFYSAPVDDLSSWTSRGVNYRATQDPLYSEDRPDMYAPDVVQGNDGRFYLYYCLAGRKGGRGYWGPISVAVSDEPDGQYEFHGHVRNPDGSVFREYVQFDPAVINDDGAIRLYYGMCYPFEEMSRLSRPMTRRVQAKMFNKPVAEIKARQDSVQGAITVRLQDDMLTVDGAPRRIVPTRTKGTSFEGHAFWEASSIRKIGQTYYFVYSSLASHELCYATSDRPDEGFVYRGVIISNGDIGLDGREPADRINQTGTNHGSIECIDGQWYVFYHRNTHASIYSRQACAEKIEILPDGTIPQVEVTSCGLNDGPLPGAGEYPAVIASHLSNGKMPHGAPRFARTSKIPRITHDTDDRFVGQISSGTTIGFKYFALDGSESLTLRTRGTGEGRFEISTADEIFGTITVRPSTGWMKTTSPLGISGTQALYLTYVGSGRVDLLSLELRPSSTLSLAAQALESAEDSELVDGGDAS